MKDNNRELIKKTAIISIGNISTKLINFLLLPFYTYILTTEEYGTYDVLHTYIYLLIPVLGFQLDQAVFKLLVENRTDKSSQKSLVSTATLFMLIQVIAYGVLFLVINLFYQHRYLPYMAVTVLCTVALYDTQQMVRGINKTTLYALAGVIGSTLAIICNIVLLSVFDLRIEGLFLSSIISSLVSICFLWTTSGLMGYLDHHHLSGNFLKKALKFGIPLIPNELAWWVIHASDRTIVSAILGLAQNGIIAVAQKFSSMYITVFNIFNLSWTESVILHFKDKDGKKYISDTIETALSLFFSIAIGIVAVMPLVFQFFVNVEYEQAYYLIPIYMIAGIVNVCLGLISAIFVAEAKTTFIASTTALAALINICAHLALVPSIGIYAAPISTIMGYGTILILRYLKIRNETNIVIDWKKTVVMTMVLMITLFAYYRRNTLICGVCLIFDVAFLVYINRQIVFEIMKTFKNKLRL